MRFLLELRLRRRKGGGGLSDLCGAFKVGQLTNDWLQKNVEDHDWMKMKMNELNLLVAKRDHLHDETSSQLHL